MFEERILDMASAYRNFGYVLMSDPLPGHEETFLAELRRGINEIEQHLADLQRRFRVRGKSKRALKMLHQDKPTPVWGVEVAA